MQTLFLNIVCLVVIANDKVVEKVIGVRPRDYMFLWRSNIHLPSNSKSTTTVKDASSRIASEGLLKNLYAFCLSPFLFLLLQELDIPLKRGLPILSSLRKKSVNEKEEKS